MTEPLGHRDIAKLRRNHWKPLESGRARLYWQANEGRWLFTAGRGTDSQHLSADTDLDALNAAWQAWVMEHAA